MQAILLILVGDHPPIILLHLVILEVRILEQVQPVGMLPVILTIEADLGELDPPFLAPITQGPPLTITMT